MRNTLVLLSLLAATGGGTLLSWASSSTDELAALTLFTVAVTMLSAAAVMEVVTRCLQAATRTHETLGQISAELADARNPQSSERVDEFTREPAYVVRTGNDSSGPFPVDKIKELRRRGAIDDDTPVALAGRNEWRRTCEVIGI